MNQSLRRLGTFIALMLIAVMISTTSVQFFQAPSLNADGRNVRTIYREFGRHRGPIVVEGESIVTSVAADPPYNYLRVYERGAPYASVTGYFSTAFSSSTGLERYANDALSGTANSLLLSRVQDLFTGSQPQGGSIELTLDADVQQAAVDALGSQTGAVVAIQPKTGAILALHSSPSFDPNVLATHNTTDAQAAWDSLVADPTRPLENRATGTIQHAPGSTFKVLVAATWLEIDPSRDAHSEVSTLSEFQLPQSTHIMRNPGGASCGDSDTGELIFAFENSCNTTFAQMAIEVGHDQLAAVTEKFGFGSSMNVPIPVYASTYPETTSDAEVALTGIGQFEVRTTPVQMAMVAAAVANGGTLMTPYLIETVRDADVRVVERTTPTVFSEPITPKTAATLTEMMTAVVESGTGTPAKVPGVTVAGKTGTAESGTDAPQHAWMIAFAPAEDPQIAVAVLLEHGGDAGSGAYGGSAAGPIVRRLIEAGLQ
ncbi:MAG: penicillin-binding protein 2 [Ruaniaceae bacterium]|nr:penicillin-binding protein 2 [Ruaniaceae bacterium]